MDSALKLKRLDQSTSTIRFIASKSVGVRHIDEHVVAHIGGVAFLVSKQRTRDTFAFNDIVADLNRTEVAGAVETEQSFVARGHRRLCNDVIVVDLQIVVGFFDPDHASPRIADEVMVESRGSFCGCLAKSGD